MSEIYQPGPVILMKALVLRNVNSSCPEAIMEDGISTEEFALRMDLAQRSSHPQQSPLQVECSSLTDLF